MYKVDQRLGLEAGRQVAGSYLCDERDQLKSNQKHIATNIFSNLVTYVDFLQLQGYISI